MEENLHTAIDEFVLARVNDFGANPPESLAKAFSDFHEKVETMKTALTAKQKSLFIHCENAFSLLDGEMQLSCYHAGFADAVAFLFGWRDGKWN